MRTLAFFICTLILFSALAATSGQLQLRAYVPPSSNMKESKEGMALNYNKNLRLSVKLYKKNGRQPASVIENKEIFLERKKLESQGITRIEIESP